MDRNEIKACLDRLIQFVDSGAKSSEDRDGDLVKLLDALSYAYHFLDFTFDDTDYPEYEREDQVEVRKRIGLMFPEYGYYNVPENLRDEIAESSVIVGDAIDDIHDIYQELKEVQWCWEHTSVEDALWHFENNYRMHWEEHVRNLQVYLHHYRTR
ncbi:MAG: DUF5063 domain-containing protein [Opitutaceae bacterium]